jgi:hypothetical protein
MRAGVGKLESCRPASQSGLQRLPYEGPRSWYAKGLRCRACASLRRNCYANPNRWLEHGFAGSNPTCPATQSVSASATQAWRSDERLISRNHRARWRHRKVQRCTVGYRRGLAGRRGSGTTPHGSGPLSTPDDSAAGSEYQCTGGARLRDSCSASMAALA